MATLDDTTLTKLFAQFTANTEASQQRLQQTWWENFKKYETQFNTDLSKQFADLVTRQIEKEFHANEAKLDASHARKVKYGSGAIANTARLAGATLGGPLAPFLTILDKAVDFDKQIAKLFGSRNKTKSNKSDSEVSLDNIYQTSKQSNDNLNDLLTSVQNIEKMLKESLEGNKDILSEQNRMHDEELQRNSLLMSSFASRLTQSTSQHPLLASSGSSFLGNTTEKIIEFLGLKKLTEFVFSPFKKLGSFFTKILEHPRVAPVINSIKGLGSRVASGALGAVAGVLGLYTATQNAEKTKGQSFFGQNPGEGGLFHSRAANYLGGTASSAFLGAELGTMILPGLGTAIGAGLGALFGAGSVLWKDKGAELTKLASGWLNNFTSIFKEGGLSSKMIKKVKEETPKIIKEGYQKATKAAGEAYEGAKGIAAKGLGSLSAIFESGHKGAAAIGYDKTGGTSYGKYQIASKTGTINEYLKQLDTTNPEWAKRLRASGPANTRSATGEFADTWKQIAKENPAAFEESQHEFIKQTHFDPAAKSLLKKTGFDITKQPKAVQDAFWSTAVQHGASGASSIWEKAKKANEQEGGSASNLLNKVYDIRNTKFGKSNANIQASVANRFKKENALAQAELAKGDAGEITYVRHEPESKTPVVNMPKTDAKLTQAQTPKNSPNSIDQIPAYITDEGLIMLNVPGLFV